MTIQQLRDRAIEIGIESAKKTETRPEKLQGCLDGFAICRKLNSVEEFKTEISAREIEQELIRSEAAADKRPNEDYWRFRCATAQIEWILEILRVAIRDQGPISGRAAMLYNRILEEEPS